MANTSSINQIAYNILNLLRGGRSSQNDHLNIDQIKFLIRYYRAVLIRRDQERNLNRFRMFEQDLGHVSLETVDSADDASISAGNVLKRTTVEIPTPIRLKDSQAITFIGNKDKVGEPIPLFEDDRVYWQQYSKYTSNKTFASFRDRFLYIHNGITFQNVNIRGIFEDPEEVYDFLNSTGNEFYNPDEPYPIPEDMLEGITKAIINGEITMALETINDTELDPLQDKQ